MRDTVAAAMSSNQRSSDATTPSANHLAGIRLTAALLVSELCAAAEHNFAGRVKLLVEHGVDVDTPGLRNGRTPYEEALRAGHSGIAQDLLAHGATKIDLDPVETFALACIGGRRDDVRKRLAGDPTLLDRLGHHGRVELLHRAVDANSHGRARAQASSFPRTATSSPTTTWWMAQTKAALRSR